jgi:hypothetical protein
MIPPTAIAAQDRRLRRVSPCSDRIASARWIDVQANDIPPRMPP